MTSLRKPDPPGETDEELVTRVITGDERAAAAVYRRHASYIAGVVYRILGQDADLDDVVQETFVEGLRCLPGLQDRSRLRAFLVTIAVRRVQRRIGWKTRWRALVSRLGVVAPQVSDPAHREVVHALYQRLARVPAKHRVAWILHRVEGFTLPEVAAHCGASLATVKRWIAEVDAQQEVPHETG